MKSARLDSLQVLRFLAAFLVLCGHAQHGMVKRMGESLAGGYGFVPLDWGLGVDIFFLISGFVMYYMMHDRFGRPGAAADFLRRRFIRVAPMYWLFTTIVLATAIVGHMLTDPPLNVAFSYLFLPGPACGEYCFPVFSLGWTLNYEMMFYAVFALGLLFASPKGIRIVIGAMLALLVMGQLVPARWTMLHFWGYPIISEFLVGIGLCWLYLRGLRLPRAVGWAMIAAGFALAIAMYQFRAFDVMWRLLTGGIPAALILGGAVLALEPRREGRLVAFLIAGGNASYALYLSHPLSLQAAAVIDGKLGIAARAPLMFFAFSVLAAVIGAFVVHHLIERPLLVVLNRRWSRAGSTGYGDGQPAPGMAGTIAAAGQEIR